MLDYYRNEQILFCKKNFWQEARPFVRVAKRRRKWSGYEYFVTQLNAEKGYGTWVRHGELTPLSALEQLALALDERYDGRRT